MAQRYFVHLAYDGSNFSGWQRQPNGLAVQQVLEEAVGLLLKENIKLTGAGRTDTGVHASCYFAHFDLEEQLPANSVEKLVFKLNSFIGPSIVIFNIFPVGDRDHARFSALSRTYQYHVLRNKDPFRIRYAHYIYGDLEINLMNHGAEILQSATDFSSFAKAGGDTKHNICTIYHCTWNEHDGELVLTITANRFLRNMVRSIVGTLLDLGRKRISINDLQTIIDRKERSCAGESVPAKGLFLTSINYPETIFKNLRNQT